MAAMQNSHDKIATRLALILTKFNAGEKLEIKALAEEFGVGVRTIQRDINERLAYLPIKKESNCYFLETYALGKLSFDDIKNFAMLSGVQGLFPSLSDGFISGLLSSRFNPAFSIHGFDYEKLDGRESEFQFLNEAVQHHQQLRFNYHAKARTVNPYKLVNIHGVWYLTGDENGTLKNYSVGKFSDLQALATTFKPNSDFVEIINKDDLKWFTENTIDVTLEIDISVSEYFLRRNLLPNQTILSRTDEKLLLSTKVSFEDEILYVAKYWLPHVKIISPVHLQEKLNDILVQYLETTQPDGGRE